MKQDDKDSKITKTVHRNHIKEIYLKEETLRLMIEESLPLDRCHDNCYE